MSGGITFKETMQGWFALGATTPESGAERGEREGTKLAVHCDVTIDDLDRFIAVREHAGALTGTVDFQPIGLGMTAPKGVFQLFSPGPEERARRMVYELAFAAEGKPCYLAGEKRVKNDAGPDLWRDTTTLFTTLHDGAGRSGSVIGAGILSLGVPQLLALVSTFKPINGGNLATVGKFGRFFFGELWEVYAPHWAGGN
jgi:cholesterol oxidase